MVLPNSHRIPRAPQYLGGQLGSPLHFTYWTLTIYSQASQPVQLYNGFLTPRQIRNSASLTPVTPHIQRSRAYTYIRFGLFPFRSPLLGKSLLFSSPRDTKMFQFSPFASDTYLFSIRCPSTTRNRFPHSDISGSMLA